MNCFSTAFNRITARTSTEQSEPSDEGLDPTAPAQPAEEPRTGLPDDGQMGPQDLPLAGHAAPDTLQGQTFNQIGRLSLEVIHGCRQEVLWGLRILALGATAVTAVALVHTLAGPSGSAGPRPAPEPPANDTVTASAASTTDALAVAAIAAALHVLELL